MFRWKKMFAKGASVATAAGLLGGGAIATLPEVDTSDKALTTALLTVGTFLWGCFNNWRKNK